MSVRLLFILSGMWFLSASAQQNNALDFDGTDDKVDCGNDTSVQISGNRISLEAWIYPAAWKTNAYDGNIICKEYNTSNYGYMLRCGAGGKLNFAFGDGSWHELTSASTVLTLNTWQHVAGTYDGSKMRIYVNGICVDSSNMVATITKTPAVNLLIGGHSSYTRFFQGAVDEVRLWSIYRSKADVNAWMNAEICAKTAGLRAYYKCNQGKAGGTNTAVKTLTDLSGYNNTGTLNAFALSGAGSNWISGKIFTKSATYKNDTLSRCDRFFSPSGKYKWFSSGVYKDTIPTAMGCDSVITFYLTIKKSSSKTIKVHACSSYVSPSGRYTWTQSGTYTDYLVNAVKCDSVVTVVLTVGGSKDTIYPVVCEKYLAPGGKKTWTKTGVYFDTIPNYRGCDSAIRIELTVLGPTYGVLNAGACKSYQSPSGKYTWTKPGIYTDTIVNSHGCDSILTITFKLLNSKATISKSACYKVISPSGKFTWTASGVYTDTLINYAGCDSVLTVNVTIKTATYASKNVTVCKFYITSGKKRRITKSGTYYDTLINKQGCDSIVTLNLEIINLNKSVTQNGSTLTAAKNTGNFQWLNCTLLMSGVSGATSRVFSPSVNGTYAVELRDSGCRDTSACYVVTGVSVQFAGNLNRIQIYPSPTSGECFLSGLPENVPATVGIYQLNGQLLAEKQAVLNGEKMKFNVPDGLYQIRISCMEGICSRWLFIRQ